MEIPLVLSDPCTGNRGNGAPALSTAAGEAITIFVKFVVVVKCILAGKILRWCAIGYLVTVMCLPMAAM